MGKKKIAKGEKVGLKLTQAERTLLLNVMNGLTEAIRDVVRGTPTAQPVMLTLNDLHDLEGHVVAEANHTTDKKLRGKLDRLHVKIDGILNRQQELPEGGGRGSLVETILDLLVSEPPAILPMPAKSKKGEDQYPLELTDKQREALVHATRLRRGLKDKIGQVPEGSQIIGFTKKELEDEPGGRSRKRTEPTGTISQFKVTLKRSDPPIWRRFQVPDLTLGELHDVLQVVMGWDGSHMHQFIVNGKDYGQTMPDDLDLDVEDEDGILLSQIFTGRKKPRIVYEYDFGDNWEHEIVLEKRLEPEPGFTYPGALKEPGLAPLRIAAAAGSMPNSSKRSATRSTRITGT